MVIELDAMAVADKFAMNDLRQHFVVNADQSPEDVRGTHADLTAMEYYTIRYDYYFDILLQYSKE